MTVRDNDSHTTPATVRPGKGLAGEITVPGDKSISHRSVIFGSIAEGTTTVEGFLEGEDNLSTISAFRSMGVRITREGPGRLVVDGVGLRGLAEPGDVIDAGNSGTTARLLTGLLSAQDFFTVLTGDSSLRSRPMGRVVEPLALMGADISGRRESTLLPLAIKGRPLTGIEYSTPVASAQLKSSILLAGLYAEGETTVAEPAKSRDHTERMLRVFGADVDFIGNSVRVRSTNRLNGVKINVPGDISSAAFFLVAAAISPGSELVVRGVGVNPTRTGILHILENMGTALEVRNLSGTEGEPVADLAVRSTPLTGVDITGAELLPAIDEFPILCVAAAFAGGTTRISGAAELRVKESDRISAVSRLLASIGVPVEEKPDGLVIEGLGGELASGGAVVESHGDHRVAMAAAVAALRCAEPLEITEPGCIDVSFPGFLELLESVRGG